MKHLLTSALIASALASPVRGEVVEFSCINVEDERYKRHLAIDPQLKLAVVDYFDLNELRYVDWRSDAISWQQRSGSLSSSRGELEFFIFDRNYRLTATDYGSFSSNPEHFTREYLCIPDAIDLDRIMRDGVE